MTYKEALAYLDSFVDYERVHEPVAMRAMNPHRMRRLCRRLVAVGDASNIRRGASGHT